MKKHITLIALLVAGSALVNARTDYNQSVTITENVSDSYGFFIDYPTSPGNVSTTRGNVVVNFAEGVSLKAPYSFTIYGTGSSANFLGNNTIEAGTISVMGGAGETGASLTAVNSTINASSISLREGGTGITLTNCTTTIAGKMVINTDSTLIVSGGSFVAEEFSQTGAASKETVADVKILNGASFKLTETESYAHNQAFNIYVDSTSTFDTAQKSAYYGKLTFEAGAAVKLSENSTITEVALVVDDVSQVEDIGACFENIKLGDQALNLVLSTEQFTSILDKKTGTEYAVTKEADGSFKLGSPIPEPSAFGLLAGLAALAFVGARRRRG